MSVSNQEGIMEIKHIPANSGDWPDYKTPKKGTKRRGMDVHQCDQCDKDATHARGGYLSGAVGEPHRFCCDHFEEHMEWIAGARARIAVGVTEIRAVLHEHFPEFAALYC